MSDIPGPLSSTDDLQFQTAEPVSADLTVAAGQSCVSCKQPVLSTYYALGGGMLCPACHAQGSAAATGSRFGRLLKASLFGLGAGLVGALIWFVIRRVTNYEIGLVAILVGVMVGSAVRKGSAGVGGRGYQILAVAITYCCIAANYMPDILESVFADAREKHVAAADPGAGVPGAAAPRDADPGAAAAPDAVPSGLVNAADVPAGEAPAADAEMGLGRAIVAMLILLVIVFALSLASPFLAGADNLIGLLIIGFALWEAWKLNAHRPLPITGPYQLGPDPVASPAA